MSSRSVIALGGALVAASTAYAALTSFTLTGPAVVYLGVPATFQASGLPPAGGTGLFVDSGVGTGNDFCPAPLLGDCMDLDAPAFLIDVETIRSNGTATFEVTPPLTAPEGIYTLQAASVSGGTRGISNIVVVEAIDTCTKLDDFVPPPMTTNVPLTSLAVANFSASVSVHWEAALYQGGNEVPTERRNFGTRLHLDPIDPLDPDTVYTMYVRNLCGEVSWSSFRTTAANGPQDYIGMGFVLQTEDSVTTPALVPIDFGATLHDTIAYEVLSIDPGGSTGTVRQGRVVPGTNTQDDCYATVDLPMSVFPNGEFVIGNTNWDGGGTEAYLQGTLNGANGEVTDVRFDVFAPDSGGLLCLSLGACGTCPLSGGTCLEVTTTGITGDNRPIELDAIVAPNCP